jgi:hypothetical protein
VAFSNSRYQVARDRTVEPKCSTRSPLHRACGINCERRT